MFLVITPFFLNLLCILVNLPIQSWGISPYIAGRDFPAETCNNLRHNTTSILFGGRSCLSWHGANYYCDSAVLIRPIKVETGL